MHATLHAPQSGSGIEYYTIASSEAHCMETYDYSATVGGPELAAAVLGSAFATQNGTFALQPPTAGWNDDAGAC